MFLLKLEKEKELRQTLRDINNKFSKKIINSELFLIENEGRVKTYLLTENRIEKLKGKKQGILLTDYTDEHGFQYKYDFVLG